MRNCPDCHSEMEMNCTVETNYRLFIRKKRKGMFNDVSNETKAAVCTVCGHVTLYVENPNVYRN